MGHTRLATQGDKKQNYNNHPFAGHADKEFAFAHNGVLWNDKELRRDKVIPDTYIDTDSYIGVQLIEKQGKLDFDSLQYMAETVEGNFTFTVLDQTNSLYISALRYQKSIRSAHEVECAIRFFRSIF